MTKSSLIFPLLAFAVLVAAHLSVNAAVIDPKLRARAIAESASPVRPGSPDQQSFWNGKAVQFQYAPAFDFKEVPGAKSYRFTLAPANGKVLTFDADKPWATLEPVWTSAITGKATLTVQGLDAQGANVGEPMTCTFHRAAVIGREYPAPAMSWGDSARTALDALVHSPDLRCWFTTGVPEEEFHLYRYPSKIIGGAAAVLARYALQTPPPADAEDAVQAARRAADYLIGMSFPKGDVWEFHPPMYHPTLFRDRLKGHMNVGHYMTFGGAESGIYYLEVHAATKDAKYLDAAVRIAETYAKRQSADGSWLMFVSPKDGTPVTDNVLIPTLVIEFLDRLVKVTNDHRFDAVREKAFAWIMNNPVRTWNWQGQFEDVKPLPPYQNLTKHDACSFAIHLLDTSADDPVNRALALDLLRFAEDQFVIWAQPPVDSPKGQNADGAAGAKSKGWMLPCVLEQYRCWAPVCSSSAKLINTYLAAWRVTHDPLHLEKAKALAGTLTRTQLNRKAPGRYQTWLTQSGGPMWFNCELKAVEAMQELAAADAPQRKNASVVRQPDIVFLLADDLGNADVGWHGSDIRTPSLDKLAASGAKLEHFYVLPVCTPTRSAFLTGRYPIRFGLQLNVLRPDSKYGLPLEERTIANAMQDAGYTTAICGKWHVGHFDKAYWPNARGFDHWLGHLEGIDYFTHNSYTKSAEPDWYRNGKPVVEDGYATTLEAREAVDIIKRQPADKPLFLYVPFTGVHGPLLAPSKESVAAYRPAMNEQRATLAAAMTAVDAGCADILAALEKTGRRDNTLIIFASDNGGLPPGRNLPYRAFKSSLYEGGIRSPAIAAWPGHIKPGTVINEPLHIVDLYPTFVKLAGASVDQKLPLDGCDILPVLTEGKPSPHQEILLNAITRNDGALLRGDWKLILNGSDGVTPTHDLETGERKKEGRKTRSEKSGGLKVELFNLRDDPGETKDLAASQPEKVKELRACYDVYARAAVKPLQLRVK